MKFRNKQRWQIIKFYCTGWTIAFIFLSIVRGVGTVEEGLIDFEFSSALLFSLTLGPVFGSISGYAQLMTEERLYKCISIRRLLILRFVFALLFLITLILAGYQVSKRYLDMEIGLISFAFDGSGSYAVYFYILVVDFVMAIIRQVSLLLGDNKLGQLLQGKFYSPREEERIFMFLDLQSSTRLAEKLGHINYSMMIQDCFNDLGIVVENEAEIYQYVGDEAILTWKLKDGLRNQNCINAYFNFKYQLASKKEYYLRKYNCQPFFKAGMNMGIVTVTEVGKYKKEIAYHGDTINTAARIQDKCNELKQELLVSECLVEKLNNKSFEFDKLGSIQLRGKGQHVPIYTASEKEIELSSVRPVKIRRESDCIFNG